MIITEDSSRNYVEKFAGGKGYNLYLLTKAGFNVPKWNVISSQLFETFKRNNNLKIKLEEIIDSNKQNFKAMSVEISKLILNGTISDKLLNELGFAYDQLSSNLIAVRSSAIGEDSAGYSFAGQLSSYLFIKDKSTAIEKIKQCWASAYSERSLVYRNQNSLSLKDISVAVVLQQMVNSEKSGVLFTSNPVNKDPEQIVINSVYGIGEGVVSGELDADTFVIDRLSGEVKEKIIASKPSMFVNDSKSFGIIEVGVDIKKQELSSLDNLELEELRTLANKIDDFYNFPQDVEWAVVSKKLYILQSRPITTQINNRNGLLYIWDNSNIVESYGGITKPLTFDFARFVYHNVYVQFAEILLVPSKQIKEMDYFLRNMLGIFYGRIYYNLLNWYKLTSILPGFKYNRSFMETMMGTSESLADEVAERIRPPEFEKTFLATIRRAITGLKFLYFHFAIQPIVDRFLKYFHKEYDRVRHLDFRSMTADEIYGYYQVVERKFLRQWKAPIINDYICMVHFGLFKKLCEKWLGSLGPSIQNDLLCGDGNYESAQPTREMIRIANFVEGNKKLKKLILENSNIDLLDLIRRGEYKVLKSLIDDYLDKYGFRCMSEMKLEQVDLHLEPSTFFAFLKNYLRNKPVSLDEMDKNEQKIRSTSEKSAFEAISGFKKLIFRWSLKNARQAVRNRENTRFCRTRIYGVVRAMFFAIGEDFVKRQIIETKEDVFYLSLPELSGAIEGTNPIIDLKKMINARKLEYLEFEKHEPDSRFMTRGPVYWNNTHFSKEEVFQTDEQLSSRIIKGIGCCPGIVEGKVKVIMSPDDDLELNKDILVTMRTDPGWVPLFPAASALLVERGGLLSHSAIVAREMGIPAVVSIKGLTKILKTGMNVRINGETGIVEILDEISE